MALITAALEAIEPFDPETLLPESWAVMSSKGLELRRYPGTARSLAELFVTEFNVKAYEVHTRLNEKPATTRASPSNENY